MFVFNLFKKPSFGLDISDFSIEVLQLERKFGRLYLGTYGRVELEEGIVENGKILKGEKLKEKIKEVLESTKPKKLNTRKVILSLPESKTFLHIFELPAHLTGKELFKALESESLKTIPLAPENLYFDFQVVSKKKGSQEILFVGTSKEIIDEYLEVLKGAGLKPLALDIESASLARAFKNEGVKEGGLLIADIGARTTVLTIFDEDSIRLSATVSVAGNHFTKAISEKMKVSLKEAEKLKKQCGLDPKKKDGKIMLILQSVLQDILEEIKKSISFYEKKSKRKIKKVLLCGGSSLLPKLSSYFASNLGIDTKVPDPWEGINIKKSFKKRKPHPVFFANVIGLAKRGFKKDPERAGINLIPLEKRSEPAFIGRRLAKSKIFSFFVIGWTIAALGLLSWVIYTYIFRAFCPIPSIKEPVIEEERAPEEITPEEEEEVVPEEELILKVIIEETETGWLRVREGPGTGYPEIDKVFPGESYPLLEEAKEWYKIELEVGREGWIFAKYASKQ